MGLNKKTAVPFDYRVEYLKSDGDAYINTLEKFNNETDEVEITIRAAGLNTQTVFGGRISATSKFCIMGLGSTGYYDIYCSDGSAYADYRATAVAPGAKCILKMSKYGRYIYNAATLQNLNANTTVGVNFVMNDYAYLFYGSGSPWANAKFTGEIYGLVWKRMGIVIHEYIPVVKNGVGYMFDRATGRLIGNTNTTGAFLFPERMGYEPEPENKPYDAEVAWLKSDGAQWIDTGIPGNPTYTRLDLSICVPDTPNASQFICGARGVNADSTQKVACTLLYQSGQGIRLDTTGLYYAGGTSVFKPYTPNGKYEFSMANNWVKVNGDEYNSGKTKETVDTVNIYLFSTNNAGTAGAGLAYYLYSAKIWNGDTLVRDYVPVRKDGVGYLYDKVSGQLFGNQGTGSFTYGGDAKKLPYDAEVEWLKSDGNQYIDTGLLADSTLGYEIFAALTSTWNIGIGAMGTTSNYRHYIRRSGTSNVGIGLKTTDAYSTHQYISDDCMHHFVVDWTSNTSLVDATYKSNLASFNNFSTGVTFHLFGIKQDSSIRMGTYKMGRCTFYRGGVMVADYHPVRVGNVGYMYEKVTGTLIGNQGTGNFIVGNDLSDKEYDAEVEYIQQTTNQYIDTGVKVTKGFRAELKIGTDLSVGSVATLVAGARTANTTNAFVSVLYPSGYTGGPNTYRFDYGTGTTSEVLQSTSIDSTQRQFTIRMYGSDTGKRGTCNSEVIASSLTTEVNNNLSFMLLGFNTAGTATTQNSGNYPTELYYCKIWENDILRRDFIPVRRNGRGLLYDRVTKTLFGSPNGGFFTYGADRKIQERDAYDARVEYIETTSSTKQTVNTMLNADSTLGVEIGMESGANFQMGVLYRGGSSSYIRHYLSNGVVAGKWGYYAGPGTVVYGSTDAANNQFHCAVYDPVGQIGRVDSTTTEIVDTSSWDTGMNYFLFDRNDSNGTPTQFAAKIYYARFFRNGQLVADMVPVRKNGKGYLYDQVRGILFGGNGNLSYGGDLYEYVTDGLIGWYDAIDNTGLGFHSEDTFYWKNKANESHTWTRYRIQNAMWKGGEMALASETNNTTILPGAFTEPWNTGEIVSMEFAGMFNGTTNTSNTNKECQLFHDGCEIISGETNSTKITFVNVADTSSTYHNAIYLEKGTNFTVLPFSYETDLGKPMQYSCVTTNDSNRKFNDAKFKGESVVTRSVESGTFTNGVGVAVINGRNAGNNRTLDGAIYGLRFYNRALTDAERAKNLKTDIARYGVF